MAALPLLMLRFIRTTALAFAVKEVGEFFGFEAVGFEEGVTVLQETFGGGEIVARVFEVGGGGVEGFLEACD